MRVKNECIPCVTRQLVQLAEKVTVKDSEQRTIIDYGLKLISEKAFESSPPYLTGEIYAFARKITGVKDPFEEEKVEFNEIAQKLVKKYNLKKLIEDSESPLETALRLSIAGNIIDFSLGERVEESGVKQSIEDSLKKDLFGDCVGDLIEAIQSSEDIMILADNSGEIVFDQLLVETIGEKHITYVVKGGPIVNDATWDDALAIGLDRQAKIMTTGAKYQGILLDYSDPAFVAALKKAKLVIAKGQANYETLNEFNHENLYFLLRGKCQAVSEVIGCPKGAFVCIRQGD